MVGINTNKRENRMLKSVATPTTSSKTIAYYVVFIGVVILITTVFCFTALSQHPSAPIMMSNIDNNKLATCEGYWSDTDICLELGNTRPTATTKRTPYNTNCPQWYIDDSWRNDPNQRAEEFIEKLKNIENVAKEYNKKISECNNDSSADRNNNNNMISIHHERGIAWSRIEEGVMVGNSEYHYNLPNRISSSSDSNINNICWTDGLLELYVKKFNVVPSKRFQNFVMNFDLHKYQQDTLKFQCK